MAQFYRVVKTNPPTARDFFSAEALNRPRPQRLDLLAVYDGVSDYDAEAGAQAQARRWWPKLGTFVARLEVPDTGEFKRERTLGPGHYTLWADADVLLAHVVAVTEIAPLAAGETGHGGVRDLGS